MHLIRSALCLQLCGHREYGGDTDAAGDQDVVRAILCQREVVAWTGCANSDTFLQTMHVGGTTSAFRLQLHGNLVVRGGVLAIDQGVGTLIPTAVS